MAAKARTRKHRGDSEVARLRRDLADLRAAVHDLLNRTTNPQSVEKRLRAMLYGPPLTSAPVWR
jgi:hypothetical protein